MELARLQQISYAEGVVEDFIESSVAAASEEQTAKATQLSSMWLTVVAGLKELREENQKLLAREAQFKSALNT